jgi:NUMOD3 motif
MTIFYTYMWLREDGTPYYIGKGSGKRAFRKGRPNKDRIIVQEFPTEEDAFEAERLLIAYYGRKDLGTGILINFTDGGEGSSGVTFSEETLRNRSRRLLGNTITLGRRHTEETKKKMRMSHSGKILNEETKKKIGDKHRGITRPESVRIAVSKSNRERVYTEEMRRNISIAQKLRRKRECFEREVNTQCHIRSASPPAR